MNVLPKNYISEKVKLVLTSISILFSFLLFVLFFPTKIAFSNDLKLVVFDEGCPGHGYCSLNEHIFNTYITLSPPFDTRCFVLATLDLAKYCTCNPFTPYHNGTAIECFSKKEELRSHLSYLIDYSESENNWITDDLIDAYRIAGSLPENPSELEITPQMINEAREQAKPVDLIFFQCGRSEEYVKPVNNEGENLFDQCIVAFGGSCGGVGWHSGFLTGDYWHREVSMQGFFISGGCADPSQNYAMVKCPGGSLSELVPYSTPSPSPSPSPSPAPAPASDSTPSSNQGTGTCNYDINGDGTRDVNDILEISQNWGNPYTITDLLGVLHYWGDCE